MSVITSISPILTAALLTLPFIVGCTKPPRADEHVTSGTDSNIKTKPQVTNQPEIKLLTDAELQPKTEPELKFRPVRLKSVNVNIDIDCQKIDKEFAKNLKISFENSGYDANATDSGNVDLVDKSNSAIKNTLINYTQQANSITCDFPLAREHGLLMKTSDDKKLRVFAWDKNTGGTMHNYAGFYQFEDDEGNLHLQDMSVSSQKKEEGDTLHSFPNALFTATLNGKITYMLASTAVYSDENRKQFLQTFRINGDNIQPTNIIHTRSLTNTLGFKYNFFSVATRPERPIQLFNYEKATQSIRFPVVVADADFQGGRVTHKYITYTFDGTYFQRVKN